jgi:transcriptional regulator with XRE-family HTH domain
MGKKANGLEEMCRVLGVGALAARLGVSESTLWRYRRGQVRMGRAVKMLWENLIAERKKK